MISGCNFLTTEAREEPSSASSNQGRAEGATEDVSDRDVQALVKPSPVMGEITEDTDVYATAEGQAAAGSLEEGAEVEIIMDRGYQWYYVKDIRTGQTGWVSPESLSIPPDPSTNKDRMSVDELETYINEGDFDSDTPYLVWVDIDRQLTHVFEGGAGEWDLLKTLECSTGENISPTLRGIFTLEERGEWFYSPRFESGGKYWVRYSGSYLFHSVAMNADQTIQDPTVGKRASAGCIRLPVEGAKWFYETVSFGSKVFIY
ncbi:MAG TPA: L,D-transpeptidase family protein [Clostridia bacterium]|nr:L,D-transpeptidase family protein [Clostridia bacterium]